jgi:hypothetical protein
LYYLDIFSAMKKIIGLRGKLKEKRK